MLQREKCCSKSIGGRAGCFSNQGKHNRITRGSGFITTNGCYKGSPRRKCKACLFGKQKRKSFPKSAKRATCKLPLVHTVISGPQKTPSLVGNQYYVAFIDDFTRMCWIFFLEFKSKVAGVFWKFKKLVENQSGKQIQILRSNHGKKNTSENIN